MPQISVIMPVWNGELYLRASVESILAQNQDVEIVAVDDGSTDNSLAILQSLPVTVLRQEHGGIAKACNHALAAITGEYWLLLDQDDVLTDGALALLQTPLASNPAFGYVQGQAEDFISPDLTVAERATLAVRPAPYFGQMSGATLLRRSVTAQLPGFNEQFRAGQAVDYMLRLQQGGVCGQKIDSVTVKRRLHAHNTSRTMKQQQFSDYGAMLRQRLSAKK